MDVRSSATTLPSTSCYVASVQLSRFRRFLTPAVVPLGKGFTALVGSNRSGKTTVLQALALGSWVDKHERDVDGAFVPPEVGGLELHTSRAFQTILGSDIGLAVSWKQTDAAFEIRFADGSSLGAAFASDRLKLSESALPTPPPRLRVIYVGRDVAFPPGIQQAKLDTHQLLALPAVAVGKFTPSCALALKKIGKLEELQEMMNSLFPTIGTLVVTELAKGVRLTFQRQDAHVSWVAEGSGVAYALTCFAAILFDCRVRYGSNADLSESPRAYHIVAALDEPTSALHPRLIKPFIIALHGLEVQVVLATHALDFLLTGFGPGAEAHIDIVSMDEALPTLRAEIPENVFYSLGITTSQIAQALPHQSLAAALPVLTTSSKVVYVEGVSDQQALRVFMNAVDRNRSIAFFENVIVDYFSTRLHLKEYVRRAAALASFLQAWKPAVGNGNRPSLSIAVLLDRDYRPDVVLESERRRFAKKLNDNPAIAPESIWLTWGRRPEWENYLFDMPTLRRYVTAKRPDKIADLDRAVAAAMSKGKQKLAIDFGSHAKALISEKDTTKSERDFDFGKNIEELLTEANEMPEAWCDAKEILKPLELYKTEVFQDLIQDKCPSDICPIINSLFDWAGV